MNTAALGLGGLTHGLSTVEMAAAYATFPNGGIYHEPRTYVKVTASDGETVVLENEGEEHVAMKETTAYFMNTLLQGVINSGTGGSAKFSGMTIAGKTGTTTSNKDKWFVGYSPYYTAAVWVGYEQQERIPTSAYLAAQMWKKVMEPLHSGLEDQPFQKPSDLVSVSICKDSGLLANGACELDPRGSRKTSMTFVNGDQPTQYCTCLLYTAYTRVNSTWGCGVVSKNEEEKKPSFWT